MCIHFTCIYNHPTFAPKQTSARIEFLRQGGLLVDKKAAFSVNFLAEKFTMIGGLASGQVNESIVHFIVFGHKYIHFDIRT